MLMSSVLQIAAIVAVAVVEGLSHVNWRLYTKMVVWWSLSCIAVLLATAFLNWQGTAKMSGNVQAARMFQLHCCSLGHHFPQLASCC